MRPIRLAVIFDQQIIAGGGYQQAINAVLLTKEISPELAEPVYFTSIRENLATLRAYGLDATFLPYSLTARLARHARNFIKNPYIFSIVRKIAPLNIFELRLTEHKIDLVYFVSPSGMASALEQLNYITTVWDLSHIDAPEFPEVRYGRAFEMREANYHAILPRATAILVDSPQGRQNLVARYAVRADRVYVMPFEPSRSSLVTQEKYDRSFVNIPVKYALDVPYVFYPAQFWPHKNHVYLLEGLKTLERRHAKKVGAIFAGGDKGNMTYVRKYAERLSLDERVRFAGFVSNDEMPYLYRQSIALVMPTYFGPTNLPPIEAFALNVPVLYPDLPELRWQVGDAALFMDLTNPSTMADHIATLLEDYEFRDQLIDTGRRRLQDLHQADRVRVLEAIIAAFRWRRICWQ